MPDLKISELPSADAADEANQFAINEGGTSKSLTAARLRTLMAITTDPDENRLPLTAYAVGDRVSDQITNDELMGVFECVQAGTTDASEPDWVFNVPGMTVDGSVVWAFVGPVTSTTTADGRAVATSVAQEIGVVAGAIATATDGGANADAHLGAFTVEGEATVHIHADVAIDAKADVDIQAENEDVMATVRALASGADVATVTLHSRDQVAPDDRRARLLVRWDGDDNEAIAELRADNIDDQANINVLATSSEGDADVWLRARNDDTGNAGELTLTGHPSSGGVSAVSQAIHSSTSQVELYAGGNYGGAAASLTAALSAQGGNARQRLLAEGDVTGGTWDITAPFVLVDIPWDVSASNLQDLLDPDILATGGPFPGAYLELTFTGAFGAQAIAMIETDPDNLVGTFPGIATEVIWPGAPPGGGDGIAQAALRATFGEDAEVEVHAVAAATGAHLMVYGLRTSDPEVAGSVYTAGVPTPGSPKPLMVSGGPPSGFAADAVIA